MICPVVINAKKPCKREIRSHGEASLSRLRKKVGKRADRACLREGCSRRSEQLWKPEVGTGWVQPRNRKRGSVAGVERAGGVLVSRAGRWPCGAEDLRRTQALVFVAAFGARRRLLPLEGTGLISYLFVAYLQ